MTNQSSQKESDVELFAGHKQNVKQINFSEFEYIHEELDLKGYSVLPNLISESEIQDLKSDIDELLCQEQNKFGADNLVTMNDHGVVRSPFLSSAAVRKQCFNKTVLSVLDQVFGDQCVLHVNRAVVSDSQHRHPAAIWHREPPYVDFTASRPLALTFVHLVDKSSAENGGLTLLPGSHRWNEFPSDQYVKNNAILPEIPAGSVLVFNSSVFHRGTENHSENARHSLVSVFTVPVIKQQINIPVMMRDCGKEGIADEIPNGRFLLGFQTELRNSDEEYRQKKMVNTGKINTQVEY